VVGDGEDGGVKSGAGNEVVRSGGSEELAGDELVFIEGFEEGIHNSELECGYV